MSDFPKALVIPASFSEWSFPQSPEQLLLPAISAILLPLISPQNRNVSATSCEA